MILARFWQIYLECAMIMLSECEHWSSRHDGSNRELTSLVFSALLLAEERKSARR